MEDFKNKELGNKIEILPNIYFCKDIPNVIYGIPGVGKRFLAKQIILKLKEQIPNLKVIGTEEDFLTPDSSGKFIRDLRDDVYAIDRLDIEHPPILYYIEDDWFCKLDDLYEKGLLQRNDIYILNTIQIKSHIDFELEDKVNRISKIRNIFYINKEESCLINYCDGFKKTIHAFSASLENGIKGDSSFNSFRESIIKRPIYLRDLINISYIEDVTIKIYIEEEPFVFKNEEDIIKNIHPIYLDYIVTSLKYDKKQNEIRIILHSEKRN